MTSSLRIGRSARAAFAALVAAIAAPASAGAQLVIFEMPGITLGDDAVECAATATHRVCTSDAGSERVLSHDGVAAGERVPLDFRLLLPPEPASGPDGNYPLVVFLHGWGDDKVAIGAGLEGEPVDYAEAGYAVLTYTARGWGGSCGASQRLDPACAGQWNHLADVRWEVRDTQHLAGLLADELSDTGTPLVDPARIGVVGNSYGAGQTAQLAALRNRVVDLDGTVRPWTSPAGRPLRIAAAAPLWGWTDLTYAIAPNGRSLDSLPDNSYRGPNGDYPLGVLRASAVTGIWFVGLTSSVFAPPGSDPDVNTWVPLSLAGEPYLEETTGAIAHELSTWHSALGRLDATDPPAPTLFVSGWSDDIFPVNEALHWIAKARALHPEVPARLFVGDVGHPRGRSEDLAAAKAAAREWMDHYLHGIGPLPGPAVRARTLSCDGAPAVDHSAADWHALSPGEVRLETDDAGVVLSAAGPTPEPALVNDPILGDQILGSDRCSRVPDTVVAGSVVLDFPLPGAGGYTVLGSTTILADLVTTATRPADAQIVARLLDVDPQGNEQLLARAPYRPDASGRQVFQLTATGHHVADGHHLQLELLGHDAPTFRPSNLPFAVEVRNLEVRVPVAEPPDGGQIQQPR